MKNSDEMIDRLLAAIHDAETPDGMKQRIAAQLRNHSQTTSRTGRGWLRVVPSWAWGACVAGVIAITMVTVRIHHSKASEGAPMAREAAVPAASAEVGRAEVHAVATVRPHEAVKRARTEDKPARPVGRHEEDSLAISEMMAPSQPAPEAPLTEQERLLLQVVRRGDPEELAMLEPEKRAARNEKEKDEVRRFFQEKEPSSESGSGDHE